MRPFIGSENFEVSRSFYRDLGFGETLLSPGFSVFTAPSRLAFYLQGHYVKDWVDNTMLFMEVEDADSFYEYLLSLDLPSQYGKVRVLPVRTEYWGKECFLTDPSGILWHFGTFYR